MSEQVTTDVAPKGGKRKLLALVLLVVLCGAIGGGWFFLGPAEAEEAPEEIDGAIVPIPAQTTTLGGDPPAHARVALAVVLTEDGDPAEIEPRLALLQDALLRELALLDQATLRSGPGSEALRERLSEEARAIWGEEVVRRVVLTELLVQ